MIKTNKTRKQLLNYSKNVPINFRRHSLLFREYLKETKHWKLKSRYILAPLELCTLQNMYIMIPLEIMITYLSLLSKILILGAIISGTIPYFNEDIFGYENIVPVYITACYISIT